MSVRDQWHTRDHKILQLAFKKLSVVAVGNLLGQNFYMPPFMATYNNLEVLVHT
jgi:hypothetical protein